MSQLREQSTRDLSHLDCQAFGNRSVGSKVAFINFTPKKRRPTCFPISGSEFLPSDRSGEPARLKKTARKKAGKKVDSSQINRNEKDQAQRTAIQRDQVAYELRKSDVNEWLEVLRSLDVLQDRRMLSEKVICNYLLDGWWDVRFSPGKRPIYLAFAEVHALSMEILRADTLPSQSIEEGVFGLMYKSVASSRPEERRVCFFLYRDQSALANGERDLLLGGNHFFPVLFDYTARKAYVFGLVSVPEPEIEVEMGEESTWACWLGPELWSLIGQEMGWGTDVGDVNTVRIVTKNWSQVCIHPAGANRPTSNTPG